MSEFLAVKKKNLVFMPAGVSYREAAMSEPAAVAHHAFKKSGIGMGDTLVSFGVGPIGLILAGWARDAGAEHIILVARSEARTSFAHQLGFLQATDSTEVDVKSYILEQTDGRGADACIEGTGSSAALELCLQCTRNFGRVVTMGNPGGDMALSQQAYWQILRRELSLVGTWNSSFSAARACTKFWEN